MRVRHVLPFVLFPVLIVSVVTLGVAAYLRSLKQVAAELVVVPPEDIPTAVREVVAGWHSSPEDWVWRACYEQDGYLIAVCTCGEGCRRTMIAAQEPAERPGRQLFDHMD